MHLLNRLSVAMLAPYHLTQAWRSDTFFDNIFRLVGVPVITVQLRYDGWVTEMQNPQAGLGGGGCMDGLSFGCVIQRAILLLAPSY